LDFGLFYPARKKKEKEKKELKLWQELGFLFPLCKKENFEIEKEKRIGTFVGFWVLFPLPQKKKKKKENINIKK
jgi:hypothetical protein